MKPENSLQIKQSSYIFMFPRHGFHSKKLLNTFVWLYFKAGCKVSILKQVGIQLYFAKGKLA